MHTVITHPSRQALKLYILTVNTHRYGNQTMHLHVHVHAQFNHFHHALSYRTCEASEATAAVAEASEAIYLYVQCTMYICSVAMRKFPATCTKPPALAMHG